MILAYKELTELLRRGVVRGAEPTQVNGTSIDVRLGPNILHEEETGQLKQVYIAARTKLDMRMRVLQPGEQYHLHPNRFVLGQTIEKFYLPLDISAQFSLKSSVARMGLEHLTAGWCDAGWHGSVLTLELKNITRRHTLVLQPGDAVGQMVFFRHEHVPPDKSYRMRGKYNDDVIVSQVKY